MYLCDLAKCKVSSQMTMGVSCLSWSAQCLTAAFLALMHEEGVHRDVVCDDTGYGMNGLLSSDNVGDAVEEDFINKFSRIPPLHTKPRQGLVSA